MANGEQNDGTNEEDQSPTLNDVTMEPPADYKYWSKKKQLEFQRKKMIRIQEYFRNQRAEME